MTLIEDIRDYWNLRSSGFSGSVLYDMDNRSDETMKKMERYLEGHNVRDILDVGCGPGFYSMLFGSKGYAVTGIDYSDKMVEVARKNAEDRGVDARFMVMDAQNLEFPDDSFDLVLSRDVFWCLEHPERAYSEILRVLRPGGMAIVSDGNYYLHHYNEDYARSREEARKAFEAKRSEMKGGHYAFDDGKVDFNVIEELAKEMPLSHEVRPYWDAEVLCGMGCKDVTLHIRNSRQYGGKELVFSFDIIFYKGE
jgi:SAM-dependent methyltransferase